MAEKMITLGKKNTLASRRAALAYITKEDVVTKLFNEIAPTYENRQGGYTRILKTGPRRGDAAEMAIVVLVKDEAVVAPVEEKKTTKKTTKKVEEAPAVEAPAAEETAPAVEETAPAVEETPAAE